MVLCLKDWSHMSLFSFEKTTQAQVKDSFLVGFKDALLLIPKVSWLGRIFKCLTMNCCFQTSGLSYVRNCIERAKDKVFTHLAADVTQANSIITVFNKAIQKHNRHQPNSTKWILPIYLFPSPQAPITHPEITTVATFSLLTKPAPLLSSSQTVAKVSLVAIPLPAKPTLVLQAPQALEVPLALDRLDGLSYPIADHSLDIKKANEWLQRQESSLQPLAYALVESVIRNYCSFPAFISSLDKSIQMSLNLIGEEPFGIITYSTRNYSKSGPWVKSLLKMKRKPCAEMLVTFVRSLELDENQITFKDENNKVVVAPNSTIKEWIYVDDASYSGTQLMESVLPSICSQLTTLYPNDRPRLHIAIPYMSTLAIRKLEDAAATNAKLSIILAPSVVMETVEDSVKKKLTIAQREAGKVLIDTLNSSRKSPFPCTTYFAHKVADGLSFPTALLEGKVVSASQSVSYHPFIPKFEPHYYQK